MVGCNQTMTDRGEIFKMSEEHEKCGVIDLNQKIPDTVVHHDNYAVLAIISNQKKRIDDLELEVSVLNRVLKSACDDQAVFKKWLVSKKSCTYGGVFLSTIIEKFESVFEP